MRCSWAESDDMSQYHDEEWGVPVHDDRKLFEFVSLEGAQAGLSWLTILRRRAGYRRSPCRVSNRRRRRWSLRREDARQTARRRRRRDAMPATTSVTSFG